MSLNRIEIAAMLLAGTLPTVSESQDERLIEMALRRADKLLQAHREEERQADQLANDEFERRWRPT